MKLRIYTVFDRLAEDFAPPFFAKNNAVAHREYGNLLSSKRLNSNEYGLFYLGEYDTETAVIQPGPPLDITDNPVKMNGDSDVIHDNSDQMTLEI